MNTQTLKKVFKQLFHLFMSEQQTVGVLMFRGDLVAWQLGGKLLHEADHFLVPGDVTHGKTGCL